MGTIYGVMWGKGGAVEQLLTRIVEHWGQSAAQGICQLITHCIFLTKVEPWEFCT